MEQSEAKYINILERAKVLIEQVKEIQKTIYRLAFIATSLSPYATLAQQLLDEIVRVGLASQGEVDKALDDVKRFRDRYIDRRLI